MSLYILTDDGTLYIDGYVDTAIYPNDEDETTEPVAIINNLSYFDITNFGEVFFFIKFR